MLHNRKKTKLIYNQKGITLIELLLYVAIVGTAVTSLVLFILAIARTGSKTYVVQEVNANGRFALDIIGQRIRASSGLDTGGSTFGSDPGVLSLNMSGGTDSMRVTEYYISGTAFSGGTYTLTLNQDLLDDYFVLINGSAGTGTSAGNRGPDDVYVSLTSDPNGTGDLTASGATDQLGLTRQGTDDDWVGVVTVVECITGCDVSGFQLLDVQRVSQNTGTTGTDTSATAWSDINQVMLMGGYNGAGCDTADTSNNNFRICHSRFYPSSTTTINWERCCSINDTTTSTVMVVEWGSEWTVQRVNATGANGADGADATSEYNTASISSVARNNTWVWGTGYTDVEGTGEAAEGVLITLGDGVNQNSTENIVAIGQEFPENKSFDVYALTHPDILVDYEFIADGNINSFTVDTTVDAATSDRMALAYNGMDGTGNNYPRPNFSARYTNNTTIQMERRRDGESFPAWIQGVDFSGVDYVDNDPTVFDLDTDDGVLRVTEGAQTPVELTTDNVKVTNLTFTNLTSTSDRENIRIEMTIEYDDGGSGDVRFQHIQSWQETVSLRQ